MTYIDDRRHSFLHATDEAQPLHGIVEVEKVEKFFATLPNTRHLTRLSLLDSSAAAFTISDLRSSKHPTRSIIFAF